MKKILLIIFASVLHLSSLSAQTSINITSFYPQVCGGDQPITVPYIDFSIVEPFNPGAEFVIYLSDENGLFTNQLELARVSYQTGKLNYTVNFSIPNNVVSSKNYYFKVASTSPVFEAISTKFEIIKSDPIVISVLGSTDFCEGSSVQLQCSTGANHKWYKDGVLLTGENNQKTITVTQSGNYQVYALTGICNTESNVVNINVTPVPVSTIQEVSPQLACSPLTVTLNASSTNTLNPTYEWLDENDNIVGSGSSFSPDISGFYKLRTINNGLCEDVSAPVEVVIENIVAQIQEPGPITSCVSTQVTLTSSENNPNYTYFWYKDNVEVASGVGMWQYNIPMDVSSSGAYKLRITGLICAKLSQTVNVSIQSDPVFTFVNGNTQSFCEGSAITFTPSITSNTYTYSWKFGGAEIATTPTLDLIVGQSTQGQYELTVQLGSQCLYTQTIDLTSISAPVSQIAQNGTVIVCEPGSATLDAASTGIVNPVYEWIDINDQVVGTGPSFTTSIDGEYRLRTLNEGICEGVSLPVNVIVSRVPVSLISPDIDQIVCDATTLSVASTNLDNSVYQWLDENDNVVEVGVSFNVDKTGVYRLKTINHGVCEDISAPVSITVHSVLANILTVGQIDECEGTSILLLSEESNPIYSYKWFKNGVQITGLPNPATSLILSGTPAESGTYRLEIDVLGLCNKVSSDVVVNITPSPLANILNSSTRECAGSTVTLNSEETDPSKSYQWTLNGVDIIGETSPSINVVVDQNTIGNYTVKVGDANCVSEANAVNIGLIPEPISAVNPSTPQVVCVPNTVTLTAASTNLDNPTYRWLDQNDVEVSTGAVFDVSVAGTYRLETTNDGKCSNISDPVLVTISPNPVSSISTPLITEACNSITLTSNSSNTENATYRWLDSSDNEVGTGDSFVVTQSGDYRLETTNNGVCMDISAPVSIVIEAPQSNIVGPNQIIVCQGDSDVVLASQFTDARYSYQWSLNGNPLAGENSASITIASSASNSGLYTLGVSMYDCTVESSSVDVRIKSMPAIISITNPQPVESCPGSVLVLNSSIQDQDFDYQWYFNGAPIPFTDSPNLNINLSASTVGNYDVEISVGGCSSIRSAYVAVQMNDLGINIAGSNIIDLCEGENQNITVSAADPAASFQWYNNGVALNGQTNSSLSVSQSGLYYAQVTDSNGCSGFSEEVEVNMATNNMAVDKTTANISVGEFATFTASGGAEYYWYSRNQLLQSGNAVFSVSPTENTVYTVRIVSTEGCDSSFDLYVVVDGITSSNIQNMITPNGDGKNDTWQLPSQFVNKSDVEIVIVDRQGGVILQKSNYNNDWDGSYNGNILPASTYYYIIKEKGKLPIMGSITILK